MSLWTDIARFISSVTNQALSAAVGSVRTFFEGDPQTRRQVAFSIAIIALSAKLAKADGIVTREEVTAFQELFEVPDNEFENVARVYNLAKQDIAGFEAYARKIKSLFAKDGDILRDVVDGLFYIAKADGVIHEKELAFVDRIAEIFLIGDDELKAIHLRHMQPKEGDPYLLLGADRGWGNDELKSHYRKLVRANHPDTMVARGVPAEFMRIANDRLAAINAAWHHICVERGL